MYILFFLSIKICWRKNFKRLQTNCVCVYLVFQSFFFARPKFHKMKLKRLFALLDAIICMNFSSKHIAQRSLNFSFCKLCLVLANAFFACSNSNRDYHQIWLNNSKMKNKWIQFFISRFIHLFLFFLLLLFFQQDYQTLTQLCMCQPSMNKQLYSRVATNTNQHKSVRIIRNQVQNMSIPMFNIVV